MGEPSAKEREVLAVKETLTRQIQTLVAYRKSLIHECVTGQRRVTDADVRCAYINNDVA